MTAKRYKEAERAVVREALYAYSAIHNSYHQIMGALNDDRTNPGALTRLENDAETLRTLCEALEELLKVNREPVGSSSPAVRNDASDTSRAAAERIRPRHGTLRDEVWHQVGWRSQGMTDRELEQLLGRSHQSVSSARNSLVEHGWLQDSGERRERQIVWKVRP